MSAALLWTVFGCALIAHATTITRPPLRFPRQATSLSPTGRVACSALSSVYSWCSQSGFDNLAGPSALASCACYYGTTWVPHVFDDIATSCYNYVRSIPQNSAALDGIAPYLNVCFLAGDISRSQAQGSSACNTISAILTSCAARTDIWDSSRALSLSGSASLAGCACYTSSSTYAPDNFDRLASACYTYAQNLAGQAGPISSLVSFCTNAGDIRLAASRALQHCEAVELRLNACGRSYTGDFNTLSAREQASCLCYDTSSRWAPASIDTAVSSCLEFLSPADSRRASVLGRLAGNLCQGFGNLRSIRPPSSVPATTTSSLVQPTSSSRQASTVIPSQTTTLTRPPSIPTETTDKHSAPTQPEAASGARRPQIPTASAFVIAWAFASLVSETMPYVIPLRSSLF
ncbi:hypothetical protein DRE_00908 [Drechslerella stenobrocha 248]|uniref:Extracellular membrane protein CFEM domain-containing protein n=1 Tax=Drechslerella stenobrocha 248 TaxID=1043628 RepID=W7HNX6_9PEZI|nr:hypothetical protein DRE_00908 [Drechslerella stenobrocha 248]